jgi:hypothetical protein
VDVVCERLHIGEFFASSKRACGVACALPTIVHFDIRESDALQSGLFQSVRRLPDGFIVDHRA